jgi:predicted glycogen debranching enzyme
MKTRNYPQQNLVRTIDLAGVTGTRAKHLLETQWLVTNGLGGFASATISGMVNWRYHGILIAALPAPLGRTSMLSHVAECIRMPNGEVIQFGGDEPSFPEEKPESSNFLLQFRLENQLPFWTYNVNGILIEKRLVMLYLQNTVHLTYTILDGPSSVQLELRPSMHFRPFEAPVNTPFTHEYEVRSKDSQFEIHSDDSFPPLRLFVDGESSHFIYDCGSTREIFYEHDADRGYESRGLLWSPGYFSIRLGLNAPVTLIASTEDWHTITALDPESGYSTEVERRKRLLRLASPAAQSGPAAELLLAADQFVITPAGRIKDAARARAAGDELRSVIAGYHWFTDWGRDTMISLEGLTLTTGRFQEAAWILRTFAHYERDGLIPNMFPEGQNEGLYHTADATLWFFHALHRYVEMTEDFETLVTLMPTLERIITAHLRGTRFRIGVDPKDGLLRQGEQGYQLTWMDAKVGDWVVTPRRGKAVEINALWYNALRLMENWLRHIKKNSLADEIKGHAERTYHSFNERFWNPAVNYLFDIVDGEHGNDGALRPNQVLAISLPYPVLFQDKWEAVLQVVREKLLTPVGLRSLGQNHPDYKAKYFGDLRSRDASYHQGTVWAWLIGPFVDAWLRVYPDDFASARQFLEGFIPQLNEGCVGSINEVFDAEAPFTPRGCITQAWSVAEVLRCLVKASSTKTKPPRSSPVPAG